MSDIEEVLFTPNGGHLASEAVAAEHSHIALADKMVAEHGHRLRYIPPFGRWFIWNGMRWREDQRLEVWDIARNIVASASEELGEKTGAAKAIASAQTVAAVVTLARCYPEIAASVDQWDCETWFLNTPAGIVDLRTGHTSQHDPSAYCSKITNVAPAEHVPDDCLWLRFLNRVFDQRAELVSFLKRALGYSLTGSCKEEVLFFGHGGGANGKTKLFGAVSGAVGDYHEVAAMQTFTASKHENHPADLAKLRGARLVTASETEEGRRWSESKIKAITGGDPITARFMRQDFFTYRPQCKIWIVGNHKPTLRNVDHAMRRRLNLIPFQITIPEGERDRDLEAKLKAEWPIILRWMIEGCLEWQQGGLQVPDAVTVATDDYMASEDVFSHWLEECCDVGTNRSDRFNELWNSWQDWAKRAEEHIGSKKKFGQTLQDRGFTPSKDGAGSRTYLGLTAWSHEP